MPLGLLEDTGARFGCTPTNKPLLGGVVVAANTLLRRIVLLVGGKAVATAAAAGVLDVGAAELHLQAGNPLPGRLQLLVELGARLVDGGVESGVD